MKSEKYKPKLQGEKTQKEIVRLHSEGLSNNQIALNMGVSKSAIGAFLKKLGLAPNKPAAKTASCHICGVQFKPKNYNRRPVKICSKECLLKFRALDRKYTEDQVSQVVALKKKNKTIKEISKLTGVKISKIKEISAKRDLLLSPEQRQANAYRAKLSKNPRAMEHLRESRMKLSVKEYDEKLHQIKERVINKEGTVGGLAKKFGMNPSSVVASFHQLGWGDLISIAQSTPQREICDFIKNKLGLEVKYNDRTKISPLELDILVESKGLAIEFCGLFWHSEKGVVTSRGRLARDKLKKTFAEKSQIELEIQSQIPHFYKEAKTRHGHKLSLCREKGVRLLTIFEDEWVHNKKAVKSYIANCLGVCQKIHGRKTDVRQIKKAEARKFLKQNHLQGAGAIDVAFGLFYNQELMAVMTGANPRRKRKDDGVIVLDRLAFKAGIRVSGGASKLFEAFKRYGVEDGYSKIVSWSDNRWSEGQVYQALGFTLTKETTSDYSYIIDFYRNIRVNKQSCQVKSLIKRGGVGSTESELAQSLGYVRIWDCGKKTWEFRLKT